LPTAATKFAYISYGLTKTAAEEMTEHTTETLMDLIKDTIKEYNKNVSNNVLNNVNEKRNDAWIDLGHKEYYYVEELTIFKGECTL
jgi:GH24 family phage-related lysozyme (muramidase)